ncbi:MAG: efflux RND transporter periplasmic adaptor subunit [Vicinamibacterales bacterium]
MTRKKKIFIGAGLVIVLGGVGYANVRYRRTDATSVTVEKISRRDLQAIVSASGKVQPKSKVDVSAETMGKVTNLAVAEGDVIEKGQLLLQIDPRNLETTVQNREASLATAKSQLDQTRSQVDNARLSLQQAEDVLVRQEGMFKAGLLARDQFEKAQNDVKMRRTDLLLSEQSVRTQEQRIRQEEANVSSARYDLNKVRIVSPIAGIVTRRNIEEGETVVTGTMNNAGTVLLTIADLSVIETEIEVDETDVPFIKIGQPAKVSIDAIPDRTFSGHVTEVGNSPIQTTGQATGRATNFKVVVTIDGKVPDVRPGFTCTAEITTATRDKALSVPIQAMTVRELIVDPEGNVVKPEPVAPGSKTKSTIMAPPAELKPGQTRKEIEGVFMINSGKAAFVPVKTGIAGEKYFEVLSGVKESDEVITGPFASVRNLKEGDAVTVQGAAAKPVSPAPR